MAYSVDNILPLDLLLTPAGIGTADFNTCFFFSPIGDLDGGSADADDILDYRELDEVAEDWGTESAVYYAAQRWFANTPSPATFTAWVWNDDTDNGGDTPEEVVLKANGSKDWRFWYFFPKDVTDENSDALAIAAAAESGDHGFAFVRTDSDLVDSNAEDTIADQLKERGERFVFLGYREQETVDNDPAQAYALVQTASTFQKFNPDGTNTAITAEYQVLPGIVGESLSSSEYSALKDRNVFFWTQVELKGQTDNSRTINTRSMSSFNEFMDDVVNTEVLKNRLQAAGYNYITGTPRKRGLTVRGYAGLLATFEGVLKQFYDNGVLGRANYIDPETGEEEEARYGYVILSDAEDVLDLTTSERAEREFPPTQMLIILARAGHTAQLTVTVE